MIQNQFPLLPDEHLYSWLVRLYWLSGYQSIQRFLESINVSSRFLKSQDIFGTNLVQAARMATNKGSYIEVLMQHTTMPIWSIPVPKLSDPEGGNLEQLLASHTHMNEQQMFSFDSDWKSCPQCRESDILNYGSSYWHASHQLPSIIHCVKHQFKLESSSKPVKNLNIALLPHQIEQWKSPEFDSHDSILLWEIFLIDIHQRCMVSPCFGARIKEEIDNNLALSGSNRARRKRQCEVLCMEFEESLGQPLLQFLFRAYARPKNSHTVNLLVMIFACQYDHKGVRNPIFWSALAFWLRDKIEAR